MGTPEFAVPTLDLLNENYNIVGVFTQPPRPSGRGMKEVKSSIQQYSEKNKLNLLLAISSPLVCFLPDGWPRLPSEGPAHSCLSAGISKFAVSWH